MRDTRSAKIIMALAAGQAALFILGSIFLVWRHIITSRTADRMVTLSMVIFWALADIAEPIAARRFSGLTGRRIWAYIMMLVCDLAAVFGIGWFLYFISGVQNRALIGAAICAVSACAGRRNREVFYGRETEDPKRNGA